MLQQDLSKAEMKRPAGRAHHPVTKYLRRIGNESAVPDFQYCEVPSNGGKSIWKNHSQLLSVQNIPIPLTRFFCLPWMWPFPS